MTPNNNQVSIDYAQVWNGILEQIKKINNGLVNEWGKDYMKIKFDLNNNIPLNKILKFAALTIVIRCAFDNVANYHPQDFLDDALVDLSMLEYNRIDISEGIDVKKSNDKSKECNICHYWYFIDKNFNYQKYLCNGCHDLMQKAMSFDNVAIASVKSNDYRIHFWYMDKDNAINIMRNSNLIDKKGTL